MIDAPSGRTPEKAPRWDLTGTEDCSGGNRVLAPSLMFSGYVGIYRRKKYVSGRSRGPGDRGAPSYLLAASIASRLALQVLRVTFIPKITLPKVSFRLDSV